MWVENQSVRLHALESGDSGTPLVIVPGALGAAEGFAGLMEALAPQRCLALSLRGAGQSDAPESGYSLEDFASDVGALMDGLPSAVLLGISMASAYVIEYAARHPEKVRGLILADWPPRLNAYPPAFAERVLAGMPDARPQAVWGIQRDSRSVELWDRLESLTCPVLVLRGGQQGSRVSDNDAAEYLRRGAQVVTLEPSGHDLQRPELAPFVVAIRAFL